MRSLLIKLPVWATVSGLTLVMLLLGAGCGGGGSGTGGY